MKAPNKVNSVFKAANLIYGRGGVFVTNDNRTHIVDSSHPNFGQIESAYEKQDFATILDLIDLPTAIARSFGKSAGSRVKVTSHAVYWDGQVVHGILVDRILEYISARRPFASLVAFLENLQLNPSFKAREGLYAFLENKNLPITEDGCFIAYKGVTQDYWSITSGSIKMIKGKVNAQGQVYNGVGEEIECERGDVNDDREIGCAKGLHVGSHSYANGFRSGHGRLMLVKVNPKDVVSVPKDCECQKVRACAYVVVGEDGKASSDSLPIGNMDSLDGKIAAPKRDSYGRFARA